MAERSTGDGAAAPGAPAPESAAEAGTWPPRPEDLVDPEEATLPWYQRTLPLAGIALVLVIALNVAF